MSEALYASDSYLKTFTAAVVECHDDENTVTLDQTAFYPGGGGQPHDTGALHFAGQARQVTRVKRADGDIRHWLDGGCPAVGTEVDGRIDWERRYQLMRTHTAMHVLCGVIWRDYGAQVTGGNMEPLRARMDFEPCSANW
jgi:misacylated tRNA(Ala) deacylase